MESPSSALAFKGWDINSFLRGLFGNGPGLGSGGVNAPNVDINSMVRRGPNFGVGSGGRNAPQVDINAYLRRTLPNFGAGSGEQRQGSNVFGPELTLSERIARDAANRRMNIGLGEPRFDVGTEARDVVQDIWQEQYDRYVAGLEATEDEVRAGYSSGIDAAQDEIADLRRAAAAVGLPFDEYMKRRNQIGAGVGLAKGLTGSALPEVNGVYDDASAEMKEVLDQIGVNFGPQVTEQLAGRVRQYEDVIEDVLRTDEKAIDQVHEKSSQLAKAMAQAAYSNDIYAAIDAETRINAQLDNRTKEAQEDLARQQKAMNDAIAAARARYEAENPYQEPSFDDVVAETWNEYFEGQKVPQHQRDAAIQIYQAIAAEPENILNENAFRRGLNEYMNQGIMSSLGVTPQMIEQAINAGAGPQILDTMASYDFATLFQSGQTQKIQSALESMGYKPNDAKKIVNNGIRNADNFRGGSSIEASHVRNLFTSRNKVSEQWDDIIAAQGPTVDESQVARAPNGYTFPVVGGGSYNNSFGYRRSKKQIAANKSPVHQGIDIMAKRGTQIVSPVEGTVVSIDYSGIGGKYVKVRDRNGNVHYFAHMDSQAKNLRPGQKVRAGTFLGTVGNTGNARDTSPHLHYGVKNKNNKPVNPYPWLRSTGQ